MPILKDPFLANYLLENQQKELRAYDQKAGYYIASNSGLFVIALFTLCIFPFVYGGSGYPKATQGQWIALFIVSLLYLITFLLCNLFCFAVLFARVQKKDKSVSDLMLHSVTNPQACNLFDFNKELRHTEDNIRDIQEAHIKANISILRKKHKYANLLPILSMIMGVLFLALLILLFAFK